MALLGGAGEGKQYLSPSGNIVNKQEVKTDAVLPAYCDPPNPCPPGFTSKSLPCLVWLMPNAAFLMPKRLDFRRRWMLRKFREYGRVLSSISG